MVADDFIDDEPQEFFGKIRIKLRIAGQLAKPFNLPFFAGRIGRRQRRFRLKLAHRLRYFKPLGQHEYERGIDIVDAFTKTGEGFLIVHDCILCRY